MKPQSNPLCVNVTLDLRWLHYLPSEAYTGTTEAYLWYVSMYTALEPYKTLILYLTLLSVILYNYKV